MSRRTATSTTARVWDAILQVTRTVGDAARIKATTPGAMQKPRCSWRGFVPNSATDTSFDTTVRPWVGVGRDQ